MQQTLDALARARLRRLRSAGDRQQHHATRRCGSRWPSIARASGPKFRFFHLGKWPGFKAGALNFALRETAPDAEIIAALDSDYIVEPDWLRCMVPQFDNPRVGFVQIAAGLSRQ